MRPGDHVGVAGIARRRARRPAPRRTRSDRPGTARAAVASANFVENSPLTRCSERSAHESERRHLPERGRAPVPERDLVARRAGRRARAGPRGPAPRAQRTGAWRCEVPISAAPSDARRASARGRTFDGPLPKRPSAGSRSAGSSARARCRWGVTGSSRSDSARAARGARRRSPCTRAPVTRVVAESRWRPARAGPTAAGRHDRAPAGREPRAERRPRAPRRRARSTRARARAPSGAATARRARASIPSPEQRAQHGERTPRGLSIQTATRASPGVEWPSSSR